jgi:hypothetical protein
MRYRSRVPLISLLPEEELKPTFTTETSDDLLSERYVGSPNCDEGILRELSAFLSYHYVTSRYFGFATTYAERASPLSNASQWWSNVSRKRSTRCMVYYDEEFPWDTSYGRRPLPENVVLQRRSTKSVSLLLLLVLQEGRSP